MPSAPTPYVEMDMACDAVMGAGRMSDDLKVIF